MNRMLPMLAVSLLLSLQVNALTIGELQVDSRIGQPFRAYTVIPVSSLPHHDSITIKMAPAYAYLNQDIPEQARLSGLSVRVEPGDDGRIVHFSSAEPVNQLFVQFIMDVYDEQSRWSHTFSAILDRPLQGNNRPVVSRPVKQESREDSLAVKQTDPKPAGPAATQAQIKQESHSMEADFGQSDESAESHSMEADFGQSDESAESHSMEADFGQSDESAESHSMEADFGQSDESAESHSMEADFGQSDEAVESQDMEATIDQDG